MQVGLRGEPKLMELAYFFSFFALDRIVLSGVLFFHAIRADTMGKIRIRSIFYVNFHLAPITFIVTDLLTE